MIALARSYVSAAALHVVGSAAEAVIAGISRVSQRDVAHHETVDANKASSHRRVHAEIRLVRDVQKALADQGFDAGTPDGIWGSKSVAALEGFQRAHRLAPSGVVTQDSLEALFPSSNPDALPAALPADVVAVPIVPGSVALTFPAVFSGMSLNTPTDFATPCYKRHRFPAEIIAHAVWLFPNPTECASY